MNQDEVVSSSTDVQLLEQIEQINLNVLLLAQSVLKVNKEEGMLRFCLDEANANFIKNIPLKHLQALAKVPYFLFPIKLDHRVIGEILQKTENHSRLMAHLIISGTNTRGKV